jgi:hypothetical protein
VDDPGLLLVVAVAVALVIRLFWRLIVNLLVIAAMAAAFGGVAWIATQAIPGS